MFLSNVVGAALSATLSYNFSKQQYAVLDRRMIGFLRAMLQGECHKVDSSGKRSTWSDGEVLQHWRILPLRYEDAVRRTSWLGQMILFPNDHAQVTGVL